MAMCSVYSLAALYSIRQKFEICPIGDALWSLQISLIYCPLENPLKRLILIFFCVYSVFKSLTFSLHFCFEVTLASTSHKQLQYEIASLCCEHLTESSYLVSILIPMADSVHPKVPFSETLGQIGHSIFFSPTTVHWHIWYMLSDCSIGSGARCSRAWTCLWQSPSEVRDTVRVWLQLSGRRCTLLFHPSAWACEICVHDIYSKRPPHCSQYHRQWK